MSTSVDAGFAPRVRRRLLAWCDRHRRDLPWRRTRDPYAIWLSEIMLQQTQVATVIPYYERLLGRFPTVQSLAAAELDEVLRLWAGLGYYARARNLHRAARMVVAEFGGRFPETVEGLRRLPGVGAYTAAAVASMAFDVPAATVDGNVARVVARLSDLHLDVRSGRGRSAIEAIAQQLLPKARRGVRRTPGFRMTAHVRRRPPLTSLRDVKGRRGARRSRHAGRADATHGMRCGDFNQAMMELGATVCLPGTAADCTRCPLRGGCAAYEAGTVAKLPVMPRKGAVKSETHVVAAIEHNGRWLVVRRPARGLWGGLWELPTLVVEGRGKSAEGEFMAKAARRLAEEVCGAACGVEPAPFCDLRHQLTHRTIRFVGYVCRVDDRCEEIESSARWLPLDELESVGMSRAMRKVVEELRNRTARRCGTAQ